MKCDYTNEICILYDEDNETSDGFLIVNSCSDCPYKPKYDY